MVIRYLGDPQRLKVALAQRELDLEKEQGYWSLYLSPASGATPKPAAATAPSPPPTDPAANPAADPQKAAPATQ